MTDLRSSDLDLSFEQYRVELTGYCYRMLGSAFEAEDAVQETLVRAWRAHDRFEGRSSLRSWLYSIATNVCLDMLKGRKRRAMPVDIEGPTPGDGVPAAILPENVWIQPMPDGRVVPDNGDPAEMAVAKESIRLAFVNALQLLPPRQRAVLILREVLHWKANEVAELLETTVVSVNSALQRARATLASANLSSSESVSLDEEHQALLARYVDAFERFDIESLVALLREDAIFTMPPYAMWMQGADQFALWLQGGGKDCRGSRFLPTEANGVPAFGQYRVDADGNYYPWAIHVLDISDGRINGVDFFVDANLFPFFGLPTSLA
jgi:RNA polymerase sigma-70 factor (ECF subfamily)